jgi:ribose-phosphate pyrophosphokinase
VPLRWYSTWPISLDLPIAHNHQERLGGDSVAVRHIIGDVSSRYPVILDDMISSGGTMASAAKSLLKLGCRSPVTVAVTHALFVGDSVQQLTALPID